MLPTFPAFAPLTLEDKDAYEELIQDYPPFSNISFSGLQIWWNLEGKLSVSSINGNLLIDYYQDFDEKNSGVCIVGKNELDASIQAIFAHQKQSQQTVKLVHVPDFVVKHIAKPENYHIEEELDYNEYILDSHALASLESPEHGRTRRKVKRFLREAEGRKMEVKPLELSNENIKEELVAALEAWEKAHPKNNDPEKTEQKALQRTLAHASHLGIRYLGLYLDDRLAAIVLYNRPSEKPYYIINHLKVDYSVPFIFDYMTHYIAKAAAQEGVDFINMEMDLGIENLRRHKMGLRPVEFFRQYSIKPAD